ncbi:MAG: hypothetical protein ACK559_17475, partial [bacterium]
MGAPARRGGGVHRRQAGPGLQPQAAHRGEADRERVAQAGEGRGRAGAGRGLPGGAVGGRGGREERPRVEGALEAGGAHVALPAVGSG